ncbi:MAG TPA: ABC transporter permease subunit [Ferrovibrio sp.]|jgi:putrescine transport system permease protein|uniref:ABC transporter permease n=1 Tax=Ferrovibrio sp. TaxID=1917215 RepID=UPI002B4B2BD1|nr:ABC transporter permease subunit [Ferrovibrio sp.]HLT79169.1 ABC transporter permease subunit [Ferrovibrio sp.]
MRTGPGKFNIGALALGLAFLYLPILLVVIYSFNASRLVTVWGGFSLHWYEVLFSNPAYLEAALNSLQVAVAAATLATVIGTLGALMLTRLGRFPGRQTLGGLLLAPMVLPEVILGVSTLMLFVAVGLDRGMLTVALAHATLGTAFVLVIVQARLIGLDPDLEAAARDLGAGPVRAFLLVTVPSLAPALAAGWLLAFTLSLDDVVIASFVNGPGATTLPVRVYSAVRLGISPEINAISTIMLAIVSILVIVASLLAKRSWPGRR